MEIGELYRITSYTRKSILKYTAISPQPPMMTRPVSLRTIFPPVVDRDVREEQKPKRGFLGKSPQRKSW